MAIGRPAAILRTLDVGGDKPLPYLPMPPEDNPFLGVRGIRLCTRSAPSSSRPSCAHLPRRRRSPAPSMFPMMATLERAARLREAGRSGCAALLADEGRKVPDRVEVGVMVEVPSAAVDRAASCRGWSTSSR